MSFWDDIGGLFTGDTYFPDNPKREHRAQELAQDCGDFTSKLSSLAEKVKNDLTQLNDELASLYGDPTKLPSDVKPVEMEFGQWGVDVAQLIVPLITVPVVSASLTIAATSYLLASGEIGAAAFAGLVGLPAAFEIGIGAAAGVAAIGLTFAIGAISGSIKRDKLRDTIHEGVRSRVKLKKAYLVNYKLSISILAMSGTIKALKESKVTIPEIIETLKEMVKKTISELDKMNDQDAIEVLAGLDKGRGSWTSEDQ
ncbi:hypothetical protein [Guptibacillus hwajinpoensis]|uniref:Uncharacterized protein n=1 Tax=Guptibacillus hwajinpoensis TaxID=208199 RepID=A0A0J6CUL3_9BACL|nr:hypothetical protein [Alkalihalobacillus macyae]KMM36755.1 hypothetical protein AB986_12505 [Alkalihalobacillus macyae]